MPLWLVIVIVAVVVLVAAAAWTWYLGYPVKGFERLEASATEAGERAADVTADFLDWLKLGR
jgi:hypothetical protein